MRNLTFPQKVLGILAMLILGALAVLGLVAYSVRNTREFLNLFSFAISNLAVVLLSFTIVCVAFAALSWSLGIAWMRRSRESAMLERLDELSAKIFSGMKDTDVDSAALDSVVDLTGHPAVSILYWDPKREHFVTATDRGMPENLKANFFLTIRNESVYCSTASGPEFQVFDIDNIPAFYSIEDPSRPGNTLIFVPMLAGGTMAGSIVIHSDQGPVSMEQQLKGALGVAAALLGHRKMVMRLREEYQTASSLDPETGACKIELFSEALEKEIERADRYESATSLLSIDITPETGAEDEFVIGGGSPSIRRLTDRILGSLRSFDLVFRDDGNGCFLAILSLTDNEKALEVAGRIAASFGKDESQVHGVGLMAARISIGVSTYPVDATLEATLVDYALAALEDARGSEGSHVTNYSELY